MRPDGARARHARVHSLPCEPGSASRRSKPRPSMQLGNTQPRAGPSMGAARPGLALPSSVHRLRWSMSGGPRQIVLGASRQQHQAVVHETTAQVGPGVSRLGELNGLRRERERAPAAADSTRACSRRSARRRRGVQLHAALCSKNAAPARSRRRSSASGRLSTAGRPVRAPKYATAARTHACTRARALSARCLRNENESAPPSFRPHPPKRACARRA